VYEKAEQHLSLEWTLAVFSPLVPMIQDIDDAVANQSEARRRTGSERACGGIEVDGTSSVAGVSRALRSEFGVQRVSYVEIACI
jgi:hypothetical protein